MRISDWSSDVCSSDLSQVEAPGNTIAFNISLSEAATEDVIVSFSTVNGTATAGSDFVGVSGGQATIEAGQLGTDVSIQLLDDQSTQSVEAFRSAERRVGKQCGSPFTTRWSPYP